MPLSTAIILLGALSTTMTTTVLSQSMNAVIGGNCNHATGPGCGLNHICLNGQCAQEHKVGEGCGGNTQFRHVCAQGLACFHPPQPRNGPIMADGGGICTVLTNGVALLTCKGNDGNSETCDTAQVCTGPDQTGQCAGDVGAQCDQAVDIGGKAECGIGLQCDVKSKGREEGDGVCIIVCPDPEWLMLCKDGKTTITQDPNDRCTGKGLSPGSNPACPKPCVDTAPKQCEDGTFEERASPRTCEFHPCPEASIAVGLPCVTAASDLDIPIPCSQGLLCDQNDKHALCECKAKETNDDDKVCTVIPYECTDGEFVEVCEADQTCTKNDRKGICANTLGGRCRDTNGPSWCGLDFVCFIEGNDVSVDGICHPESKVGEICSEGDVAFSHQCADGVSCFLTSEQKEDLKGGGTCLILESCKDKDSVETCDPGQICTWFGGTGQCAEGLGANCNDTQGIVCGRTLKCDNTSGDGVCVQGPQCGDSDRTCADGTRIWQNPSNNCKYDPCPLIAVGLACDAPTGDAANPCAQDFKCNGLNPTTGCECRAKDGGESVCTVIPYECTDGGNVEVCKADQICSEPDRKGMCEIVIGGECNRDTGPGCGPNHRCDEGECAREHTVGESCGGLNQFRHLCAEGLECTVPPQFEGLEDVGGICTVITIAVPGCQLDAFICPDGSTVGRKLSNGCEFDPCPLIDVGLACDAPTGGAVDPCAQGRQCNQGNENAVCECHAKEAGGDSVCTESLFCTSAIVKCLADDSEATRNHLNGCKADCPLIDGGDACNNDNSCAQGVECNQGDENAVCECKVTEAGYGSVCTVTNSDTIGKPGCKRRLRDNKQN